MIFPTKVGREDYPIGWAAIYSVALKRSGTYTPRDQQVRTEG